LALMARIESIRRPVERRDVGSGPHAAAPSTESWSELSSDVFALPAAVEAAQASLDEGPGPWPPEIADDPAEPPAKAPRAAAVPVTLARRRPLDALKGFLRRVKTRRRAVVSEYSAE
jgi:hypothetical protein